MFTCPAQSLLFLFPYFTVLCNNRDVRLVDGTNNREGRVEVCDSEVWGTVCDDAWGTPEAEVVCFQLGYTREGTYTHMHKSYVLLVYIK